MGFWEQLSQSAVSRNSLLCVGLDPNPSLIPAGAGGVADFLRRVIDVTADVACVYKPNIAFFEALGLDGLKVLRQVIDHVPADIPVLLDAKRGDISSTADAYAHAVYDVLGAGAVTLSPYLGYDSLAPFLEYADRGVFVLCKTSNPSAGELQDLRSSATPIYVHVARLTREWAGQRDVGLVVGATYPEALQAVRGELPNAWLLVPGIGAQGGDAQAVVAAALRPDGLGLLVNSSRGILYADDPRQAALALRDRLNAYRESAAAKPAARRSQKLDQVTQLARVLLEAGCVQFGDFVLHSGAHSPVYVDLRRLVTFPRILAQVAETYAALLAPLTYDRIAAIPYAGLPIGTAAALATGDPLIYPRREAKSYGTRRLIEGEFHAGETAVLLDDLISSGASKLEAMQPLVEAGLNVRDVVVLIDREQGGREDLAQHGLSLHAACTLRQIVRALAADGTIDGADAVRVFRFLDGEA